MSSIFVEGHTPMPPGIKHHLRHSPQAHVRITSRSRSAATRQAVRHGNNHPCVRNRSGCPSNADNHPDHCRTHSTYNNDNPSATAHDISASRLPSTD
jgi:hypothetical protein